MQIKKTMMTLHEINKTYNRIVGSLDAKELKEAFEQTQSLIAGIRDYSFMDQLNELQNTYKYMLRYRLEGAKDPMEEQIYHQLIASAYLLADQVRNKALAVESPLIYYSRRRVLQKLPLPRYAQLHAQLQDAYASRADSDSYSSELNQRIELALTQLFDKLWTSDPLSAEETAELQSLIKDRSLPFEVGCQLVSAILLALQYTFDITKVMLLFDAAEQQEEELRCRALICLLLTCSLYRKRLSVYPELERRLASLVDLWPGCVPLLRMITLRFISARETEKINQKLQNEILPEMFKHNPIMNQKINLKDITPESLAEGMNPEWEKMFENKQFNKYMDEFQQMRSEGADLLHSSFVFLKRFPFFNELGNWFLPFSSQHSALRQAFGANGQAKSWMQTIYKNPLMCNSDKYSFYFSLMQLPDKMRQMMNQQFDQETLSQMDEAADLIPSDEKRIEHIIIQYVQDLYRFFKIYPGHLDFEDVFTYPLDFHNLPLLRPYMEDKDTLTTIAEFYLRKNYFEEALAGFKTLAEQDKSNGALYQKMGYCKQMMGQIKEALDDYLKADVIRPDSKWLNKRIAYCYRNLKQPEKALSYYHKLEAQQPDDLALQINIGHCHLELKNYNEALKYFYKVDYLDSSSTKAWRPIAWCSFLTGKYDQARHYYRKILGDKPTTQDYLNAGHTEWALQQMKEAVGYYTEAVRREQGKFASFREAFEQDIPDLLQAGVEQVEIPLMMDQIRYAYAD